MFGNNRTAFGTQRECSLGSWCTELLLASSLDARGTQRSYQLPKITLDALGLKVIWCNHILEGKEYDTDSAFTIKQCSIVNDEAATFLEKADIAVASCIS